MQFSVSWIKYLKRMRGTKVLNQALRMFRLHAVPFSTLLRNIFDAMELNQAKFTFPIVASVASKNPELTREILRRGHEVAVHGFKHLNYTYLTAKQQETDIKKALDTFETIGVQVYGFRAPYNTYAEDTPKLVEKYGFLWDIGIGYKPEHREGTSPFRVKIGDSDSSFICIPVNVWSDDLMVDIKGFSGQQMEGILKRVVKRVSEKGGVVMFDLHPIRIGQPKYIDVLKHVVEYGTELKGWFPTVTEAVNYWNEHGDWKNGTSFCCLMTGDIDNFSFFDYLQRLF